MVVMHVAPHPDDELLGAAATLLILRDAGHQIVNVACSLGRRPDAPRRRAELDEACRRAGFVSTVVEHPLTDEARSHGPRREEAQRKLSAELGRRLGEREYGLVVGPSPHDRHPGHEIVARALRTALEAGAGPDRWWMWGLWGVLPFPTTIVEFGQERLEEINRALAAHEGELARNDYRRLVSGRAEAATALSGELTFGFGAPGLAGPYAEATTEVVRRAGGWWLGARRRLDVNDLLPEPTGPDVGWWVRASSAAERLERAADASGGGGEAAGIDAPAWR